MDTARLNKIWSDLQDALSRTMNPHQPFTQEYIDELTFKRLESVVDNINKNVDSFDGVGRKHLCKPRKAGEFIPYPTAEEVMRRAEKELQEELFGS